MKITLDHFKRFNKQIILKKVGVIGQKKILSAKVLVVGAGVAGIAGLLLLRQLLRQPLRQLLRQLLLRCLCL